MQYLSGFKTGRKHFVCVIGNLNMHTIIDLKESIETVRGIYGPLMVL
jgi:hypothetical protein